MAEREKKRRPATTHPRGDDDRGDRDPGAVRLRARSSRPSSTTCSTRSTRCSRRTPRSSSATTSRRAGSSRVGLPLFPPGDDPGPSFAALIRRSELFHPVPGPVEFDRGAAPGGGARHDRGGAAFRRRGGDGRRPSRHRGQHHRPSRHGEGLSRRPALGGGHRRRGRSRRRDGQALPDPARALREGGRGGAEPRGQGQPARARWCASTSPWPCRDSWSCPCSAGYDVRLGAGPHLHLRRHGWALRRGRPRRHRVGGRDARTTIKLGWRADLGRTEAVELAVRALYEAADEDSATGGPDLVRGIFPVVATVTGAGLRAAGRCRGGRELRLPGGRRSLGRGRPGGGP